MVELNINNMFATAVGAEEGISKEEYDALLPTLEKARNWVKKSKEENTLPFLNLPEQQEMINECLREAEKIRKNFDNFVILGIGGSALGPWALHQALNDSFYNLKEEGKRSGPRLFIADNSDPRYFNDILNAVDIKKTCFNVISKSGSTAETMSQFMFVSSLLQEKAGERWREHLLFTTDPQKGTLRKIAQQEGITALSIDPLVGGRFSLFTPVGLLPAAVVGIDIQGLMEGVKRAVSRTVEGKTEEDVSARFAAVSYLADTRRRKNILVLMPYANALYGVADWFRQLWAESLGKEKDRQGNVVHTGQTPVKALGATDQHSQVQLYVEGPKDKMTVFITLENYGTDVNIPQVYKEESSLSYLSGKSFAELIKTEQEGTEHALTVHQHPNATLSLTALTPQEVGELFMSFEIATALAGELYNINAFNQPGVEWGKEYVYKKFGKEGY